MTAPHVATITVRQREVIDALMHDGASDQTIGRRLGIGPETVGTHLRKIYKSRERSRRQLQLPRRTHRRAVPGTHPVERRQRTGAGKVSEIDRNSDRWRAVFVLFPELEREMTHNLARLQFGEEAEGQIDRIVASWAAEREKARAPFLALITEWEDRGLVPMGHYATRALRRAAEEGPR